MTHEHTWSSRTEVKARPALSHVLRASPGRMVGVNIANLPCEGQVTVVVLDKVVGNPAKAVQGSVCLSSCCVPLQAKGNTALLGLIDEDLLMSPLAAGNRKKD